MLGQEGQGRGCLSAWWGGAGMESPPPLRSPSWVSVWRRGLSSHKQSEGTGQHALERVTHGVQLWVAGNGAALGTVSVTSHGKAWPGLEAVAVKVNLRGILLAVSAVSLLCGCGVGEIYWQWGH